MSQKQHNKLASIITLALLLFNTIVPLPAAAFDRLPRRQSQDSALKTFERPYVDGEVIIKYKCNSEIVAVNTLKSQRSLRTKRKLALIGAEVATLEPGKDVEATVKALSGSPLVEYAQPNYIYYSSALPNDKHFSSQWGLDNTGQSTTDSDGNIQPGIMDIDMDVPAAWTKTEGISQIVVAVIDEGVDASHPDISANVWKNSGEIAGNGLDDDGNNYIDDVNGWDFANNDNTVFDDVDIDEHGTHVAGIIAAASNNNVGIAGVAPKVKVMPLKFMRNRVGVSSDAIDAITYAKNNGARIVNCSWGDDKNDSALQEAIRNSNLVFVTSVGNGAEDGVGDNNDLNPVYPANFNLSNIISVAAVDNRGNLADFSNYGAASVDVGAPGVGIMSLSPDYGTVPAAVYSSGIGSVSSTEYKAIHFGFGLEHIVDDDLRTQVLQKALTMLDTDFNQPILVIDDDNSQNSPYPDARPAFETALSEYNVTYLVYGDIIDGPSPEAMAGKTVIWFTGEAYGSEDFLIETLTSSDRANLREFLDNGGRLLLSGDDLAYKIEGDELFTEYLGEDVGDDLYFYDTVQGVYGNFTGLDFTTEGFSDYKDWLMPLPTKPTTEVLMEFTPYQYMDGTSMAAPYVSGLAALILSAKPGLTPQEVISIIKSTTKPLASLQGKTVTGGMVNAYDALVKALEPVNSGGGGGGGGGGGTVPVPVPVAPSSPGDLLGAATIVTATAPDGKKTATAEISPLKLEQILQASPALTEFSISLQVPEANKEVSLPAQVLARLAEQKANLNIITGEVSLKIPLAGIQAKGADIKISIQELDSTKERSFREAAWKQQEFSQLGKILEFSILASSGGNKSEIKSFGGKVVTGEFNFISSEVQGIKELRKLGVYKYLETSGTWQYVPSKVVNSKVVFSTTTFSKYSIMAYNKTFQDIGRHWAKEDIELMASKQVVQGLGPDQFAPEAKITRAQFAALLVRAMNLNEPYDLKGTFKDVTANAWYYPYVEAASKAGIIKGTGDKKFLPDKPISREEMAVMMVRATKLTDLEANLNPAEQNKLLSKFKDQSKINAWALPEVASAVKLGIFNGAKEDSFVPAQAATRAESAVVIKRLMEKAGLI